MTDFERNKTEFCIVGTQRTGTTYFRTSLDSHPGIYCAGELFLGHSWPIGILQPNKKLFNGGYWQHARSSPCNFIESIFRRRLSIEKFLEGFYETSAFEAVGFKLMLSQLRAHPFVQHFLCQRKVKILHLTRNNVLATLISRTRARHTGVYHVSKSENSPSSGQRLIFLEEGDLVRQLRAISDEVNTLRSLFAGFNSYLSISYEDFCTGDNNCRDAIFSFLNVDRLPLTSDLQKIISGSLDEVLENSASVHSILKKSEFAYCLDSYY